MTKTYTVADFGTHVSAVVALGSMVGLWITDTPIFLLLSVVAAIMCLLVGGARPRRPDVG